MTDRVSAIVADSIEVKRQFFAAHAADVERAAEISAKRDFECGDGQLVHTQRAKERVAANSRDQVFSSSDDSGLRPAKQFIPAEGDERERLWALMTSIWPNYDVYQTRTERRIPVVVLEHAR